MKRFAKFIVRVIHRFPTRRNHAVLWGWPDHEDSVIALEQALQESPVKRIFLLMSDTASPPPWQAGAKTRRLRKNSIAGFLRFCTARYVFFTHPCFTRSFPPDVISVNVWHGMPIKRIGWLMEGDEGIASSHVLATSPLWGHIMEQAMCPHGDVLCCGLPRNDRLFMERAEVCAKLGLASGTRLLIWLPTYRKSARGFPRTDGIASGNVFEMPDVDAEVLNSFLAARDAVMLVKPHPMAAFGRSEARSNLLLVDDAWLAAHELSLYQLLGATDALVSDVSSVVIDYLLIDKPVIHAFSDLTEYEESRGFTVDSIADWFAGPVVTTAAELHDALARVLAGDDLMADKRHEVRDRSHTWRDGGATRRLLEDVGLTHR